MIELPGGALVDIQETVLEVGSVRVHEHIAPARTIERWKNKDGFRALQRTYLPEIREAENALWLVWVSRFVDYAADEQLDMIGRIVGERRQGRNGANYRLRIKARILINKSFGRVDDIALMLQVIEPATAVIYEGTPAFLRVDFDGPLQGNALLGEIASLVSEARAAGVGASVVAPTSATLGLRWGDTTDLFQKFNYTVGTAVSLTGAGTLSPGVGVDNAVEPGCLLALHVCCEDGTDFTPAGPSAADWVLRENRLLDATGPARHKLWTRVTADGTSSVADLVKASGAGLAIARMYAFRGGSLGVAATAHEEGTGAPTLSLGALERQRAIVFTALDSAESLSTYSSSLPPRTWSAIGSATAGASSTGVGIHAHMGFRDTGDLTSVTADNPASNPIGDWGTITLALEAETLQGWNYGLLADRRRA